ncbi:hypothetical protein [Streptomyces purpurascens]|uniref:SnoaL-like domain-containing protein n=1 Tax=Streptomyces purpurascens TaxID=1924 RepID=A0ABZ1MFR6_STREF
MRTTTSLVWRATPDGWRIVREHNSTKVLSAGALDGMLPIDQRGPHRRSAQA